MKYYRDWGNGVWKSTLEVVLKDLGESVCARMGAVRGNGSDAEKVEWEPESFRLFLKIWLVPTFTNVIKPNATSGFNSLSVVARMLCLSVPQCLTPAKFGWCHLNGVSKGPSVLQDCGNKSELLWHTLRSGPHQVPFSLGLGEGIKGNL